MLTTLSEKVNRFFKIIGPGEHTYYPDAPRKSKLRIISDNLIWALKHRELNQYYYIYGLDRRNKEVAKQVISYRTFTRIRDSRNLKPAGANFNYAALLQDKFVFGQFLNSLRIPTPVNVALLDKQNITWLDNMQVTPLSGISNAEYAIDGFCKQLNGMCGKGAFRLRIDNGKIYVAENESSVTDLSNRINGTYLLQQRVSQHPVLDELYPRSLNTMRIVTFNNNGKIEVFNAAMKIGTGQANVDNWGYGGIAVGIDLHNGRLRTNGFYKPKYGRLVQAHPDTNVRFDEFTVPMFQDSLDLARKVHSYLYGVHSIGWDVAVSPDGPVIIEGNEDWDGSFAMAAEPDFKTRFMKMFRNDAISNAS